MALGVYHPFFKFIKEIRIIQSMLKSSLKHTRCHTQTQKSRLISLQKGINTERQTKKLLLQAKFINPYLNAQSQQLKNERTIFQQPHSIVLLNKRDKKAASQITFSSQLYLEEEEKQQKYPFGQVIGKGSFGIVYLSFDPKTNKKIAIKKVFQDIRSKNKQICLLNKLNHPNIIRIIDNYTVLEKGKMYTCIVSEYFDTDLFRLFMKRKKIDQNQIKNYAYQILKGVSYIHSRSIVHRDLKLSNIFLLKQNQQIAIGDFGSAMEFDYQKRVSSDPQGFMGYRAPEIVFGSNNYSFSSDIWAFGCLLAEMARCFTQFTAKNKPELMVQLLNLLGTPSRQQMHQMNPNFTQKQYQSLPKLKQKLSSRLHSQDKSLEDLLKRIFVFSPSHRPTADELLNHQYFKDIHHQNSQSNQRSQFMKSQMSQSLIMMAPDRKMQSNSKTIATLSYQLPLKRMAPKLLIKNAVLQRKNIFSDGKRI